VVVEISQAFFVVKVKEVGVVYSWKRKEGMTFFRVKKFVH
jgi:hypothetical protein